ncbi:MAG: penicillin-binding transpeptidase domain-containing protein [Desulfobacterales bacterium]|jgi:cell division protein FtsI/penicillin-binding protein 2
MGVPTTKKSSWRDYQAKLQRERKHEQRKKFVHRNAKFVLLILLGCLVVYFAFTGSFGFLFGDVKKAQATKNPKAQLVSQKAAAVVSYDKDQIHQFIDAHHFADLRDNYFEIHNNGRRLQVQTSIDPVLQNYLTQKLDRKNSSHIGIVAMDPDDGRILSLVGFNKADPSDNPCLDSSFPAASIFKIVTAAAALEKGNLGLESKLRYNGRKYTLYKSQLKEKRNKFTNTITLKEAFAKSVNPVFGKLGALYLGKTQLETYAEAFGFNREINFEVFLAPSQTVITDEPYQWAEIACGFNRQTRMSPVHGALISATIFNRGKLIEPTIIERIHDAKGTELYQSQPAVVTQAFAPHTSAALRELMKTTIRSGTVRGTFRKYRRDKIISRLEIGGKTGTINNKTDDVKYEWFVGYAQDKGGDSAIILSVLVAHQKYIGIRAPQYAIMAFKKYFKTQFARMAPPSSANPG